MPLHSPVQSQFSVKSCIENKVLMKIVHTRVNCLHPTMRKMNTKKRTTLTEISLHKLSLHLPSYIFNKYQELFR